MEYKIKNGPAWFVKEDAEIIRKVREITDKVNDAEIKKGKDGKQKLSELQKQ